MILEGPCIIFCNIYTFQWDTQCSSTDCLLRQRCQLYMFWTVTVHPQELLFRCCMCRLWCVVRNALSGTSRWCNVWGSTLKYCHVQGHIADKLSDWTKYFLYRCKKKMLITSRACNPKNKFNVHAVVKKHLNVQSMLKNYKCFHLTHFMQAIITSAHAIKNWYPIMWLFQ